MQPKSILYHSERGIAWITLNRPDVRNSVNLGMATEIKKVSQRIMADDSIRVIVLTGTENTFCTGDEYEPSYPKSQDQLQEYLRERRTAGFLGEIEKPIVAAINGDALGHGLEMALTCDIRIAAKGARLGMTQISQGDLPWDGGTQRLPRIIGRSWATDLLLTGRIIDTNEALNIGLVHQVVPPEQLITRVQELADSIILLAPVATRYAKEAIIKGMDMTLEQGMRLEMDLNLILQTTEDRKEGIDSFLKRRQPTYKGE